MNENHQLDILIPVFNENETIVETLKNIFSTVKCDYRILICYDYDEDPTLNIIKKKLPIILKFYLLKIFLEVLIML